MARQITKQLALKIVRKLKGTKAQNTKNHDLYDVCHTDGRIIVRLSVRRSSERDKGHDHMQRDLRINTHLAKRLASCSYSRKQWFDDFVDAGHFHINDEPGGVVS